MLKVYESVKPNKKYKLDKLGLHCHCADSKDKLLTLLTMAKTEGVNTLVINNYKSLKIYNEVFKELNEDEFNNYQDMQVIPSFELPASFNYTNLNGLNYNIEIHILGYGVNLDKENLLNEFIKEKYKTINQEEELKRLIKIGHEIGLKFNDEDVYLDLEDDNRKFAGRAFVQALMKDMEANFCSEFENNKNKLPYELRTNWRAFQNRCVKDLNNPFYLDLAALNPRVNEVIDLIHQMDGKAYLAHPSSYFAKVGSDEDIKKAFADTVKLVEDFLSNYSPLLNTNTKIDGVEVYHPSYLGNKEIIDKIINLAKTHNIATSGGTDIHVDKTLGENETVSSDSLGDFVTEDKLINFANLSELATPIEKLKSR